MRPLPRVVRWPIATALVAFLAGPAGAAVISLWDFDGNNLPGATTASEGNFTLDSGSFGLGPYQGATGGVLQTSGGSAPGTIESNLGLRSNVMRQIFNTGVRQPGFTRSNSNQINQGSAFQIAFDALAGDVLAFDWNMLSVATDRGPPAELEIYTDFAWYDLSGAGKTNGALANVNDGRFDAIGPTAFSTHTGKQSTEITLGKEGAYTITVGVNDVADTGFAGALLFDFFRLVRAPEPGTFGTIAAGLMGLSWLSRHRKR